MLNSFDLNISTPYDSIDTKMNSFQVVLSNVPSKICDSTLIFHFDSSYQSLDMERIFIFLEQKTNIPFYYFKIHKGMRQYNFIDFFSGRCKEIFNDSENTFFFKVSININGEKQIKIYFEKLIVKCSFHRKNAFHLSKFLGYLEDTSDLYSYLENLQLSSVLN